MNYWERRKEFNYYKAVKRLIELCGARKSILDVGSANTPIAQYGDFQERYRIDKSNLEELGGVCTIQADWLTYPVSETFSLVVCCQVVEHLSDEEVKPFVDKLFEAGENVIISVPYLWAKGACKGHPQDPINLEKFNDLIGGRDLEKLSIESDSTSKRLVAFFVSPQAPRTV